MTPDEMLDRAADLFDQGQRWTQGSALDPSGGICLQRAVVKASGQDTWADSTESVEAFGFMSKHLDMLPFRWNDMVAKNKQEVIDKLREMAKAYRQEKQV